MIRFLLLLGSFFFLGSAYSQNKTYKSLNLLVSELVKDYRFYDCFRYGNLKAEDTLFLIDIKKRITDIQSVKLMNHPTVIINSGALIDSLYKYTAHYYLTKILPPAYKYKYFVMYSFDDVKQTRLIVQQASTNLLCRMEIKKRKKRFVFGEIICSVE